MESRIFFQAELEMNKKTFIIKYQIDLVDFYRI